MIVAQDKEDYLYVSWSNMKHSDRAFLADFAKSKAMKDTLE